MKKMLLSFLGMLAALIFWGAAFADQATEGVRLDIIYTGNTWGYLNPCPT